MIVESMKNRILLVLISVLFFLGCKEVETEKTFINNCFDKQKSDLINKMVSSFENNICDYYDIDKKNAYKAYIAYVNDFANGKENLRAITTKNEQNLLNESNKLLEGDVWIKSSEVKIEFNEESLKNATEVDPEIYLEDDFEDIPIVQKQNKDTIREYKDFLVVNYNGKFSDCLINSNSNTEFNEAVNLIKETGGISPVLIANGLKESSEQDFKDLKLKTFIAFELYYAILNMIHEK